MNAQQNVFRIRRNYNRWVANETLEDYALRFTAKKARRWSAARVSHTALGAISFLALEAIGGAITLSYGFTSSVAAILVVGVIIFLTGIPISYHASKQGVDIDLLTRGAGFGYIGSTLTSLIYASFTFIFFALEAAIMALALELTLDIPLTVGYFISAVVVIPLVTHGITLISRFQVATQPLWILLQLLPLICIALQSDDAFDRWVDFEPQAIGSPSHFSLIAFGGASAVLFSLIAQIGEQVDFLRFLPPKDSMKPSRWWLALISAGPGWILTGALKILTGSFLAVLALSHGVSPEEASDPNHMYLTAFSYLTNSPELTLVLVGAFVILSQLKINVTNAYAGSIAWSNFFSRLTHNHPGRVVWLVFNVAIALTLMELGIYRVLEEILGAYAIVALAWVGSLVADLVINKPLGLRPPTMEFRRAHLYDINPVGVGSMFLASIAGFTAYFGAFGEAPQALSSFIALGTTFIAAPVLAWLTQGRYYIARNPVIFSTAQQEIACCICGHRFETEDMSHCPAYEGPICSLCCSLDTRCHDQCKTDSRLSEQLPNALSLLLPRQWVDLLNTRLGHFLALFALSGLVIYGLLYLVYFQVMLEGSIESDTLAVALTNIFFILLIVCGVISWMFALVHESRQLAQEESRRQTALLLSEIDAHQQTDLALQEAKNLAEAANKAKSRYLTGISHELRSPLNAILGYAQLLEQDPEVAPRRREALSIIRRSSEYLADLIEGLLDLSRIEAGRLEFVHEEIQLPQVLDQMVNMFRMQAESKGLIFEYLRLSALPERVKTDEKRLRQILINLLSNAVKYTAAGHVRFTVRYRNQVAEFTVEDSGPGIAPEDQERIFRPFERIRRPGQQHVPGTGLGLTITKLLSELMGGELTLTSEPGKGSRFRVSLMLSSVSNGVQAVHPASIIEGYEGPPRTLMVVDDEPSHRRLLLDILTPLGFKLIEASDGPDCLEKLKLNRPDAFLLDLSMPGMNGWELARRLRSDNPQALILITSADATEGRNTLHTTYYNGYVTKPFNIDQLLEQLASTLQLTWQYRIKHTASASTPLAPMALTEAERNELIALARIGYPSALRQRLDALKTSNRLQAEHAHLLNDFVQRFDFAALIRTLEEMP